MPGIKTPDSAASLRVLIVEDELLIAMDMEDMLRDAGYQVLGPATTVGAALQIIEHTRPDIAVLDVNLRGEKVTPVVMALKDKGVPMLLASASLAHLRDGEMQGIPNLGKPVRLGVLQESITAMMRRK